MPEETPFKDRPAFPVSIPGCGDNGQSGITVRDYFAAHALAALSQQYYFPKDMAIVAYQIADYMIKARKEQQ